MHTDVTVLEIAILYSQVLLLYFETFLLWVHTHRGLFYIRVLCVFIGTL